ELSKSVYGANIAQEPTEKHIGVRQAPAPDAEASLRAELSGQIEKAQADIEKHLAALHEAAARGGDNSPLALAKSQLIALTRLQKRVSEVGAGGLASMRGEVTAMVAATQAVAQPGTALDVQAQKLAQVSLQQARVAARESVANFARDYYENRIFDRYLKFASVEDEEEYRRREQERKQAIDKALAEHTPQGDLRANQLSLEQLKDAGAHGADRSP